MNFENKGYFVLLILAILSVSITQVVFKIVADKHKEYLLNVIYDYRLYIAIVIYSIAFVLWIIALSKIDFSLALPFNMLTIIAGGIFGYYIFGENISIMKIGAYLVISIGLLMLYYDSLGK